MRRSSLTLSELQAVTAALGRMNAALDRCLLLTIARTHRHPPEPA